MRKSIFILVAVIIGIIVLSAREKVPRVMRVFCNDSVIYERNVLLIDSVKFESGDGSGDIGGGSGDSDTSYLIPDSVYTEILSPDVSFNMVKVKGGKFVMGAQWWTYEFPISYSLPNIESVWGGEDDTITLHNVILSDFFIGETEITQGVWEYVMGAHELSDYPEGAERVYLDPAFAVNLKIGEYKGAKLVETGGTSKYYYYPGTYWDANYFYCHLYPYEDDSEYGYGKGDNYPVYYVSYDDITAEHGFLDRLNALTGKHYCLPTEAQWEYAARGGQKNRYTREVTDAASIIPSTSLYQYYYWYSGSMSVGDVAWFCHNSSGTNPVKTKQPNDLGIYDMSGNVREICADWFSSRYYSGDSINPTGPSSSSTNRIVVRGGSWASEEQCRVAYRESVCPKTDHYPESSHYCSDRCRDSGTGFRVALVP